jgi:hypothetical protein
VGGTQGGGHWRANDAQEAEESFEEQLQAAPSLQGKQEREKASKAEAVDDDDLQRAIALSKEVAAVEATISERESSHHRADCCS